MKRTYQPKKRQRIRMSGFRARMKKAPHILKSRRQKGRWRLAVTLGK